MGCYTHGCAEQMYVSGKDQLLDQQPQGATQQKRVRREWSRGTITAVVVAGEDAALLVDK